MTKDRTNMQVKKNSIYDINLYSEINTARLYWNGLTWIEDKKNPREERKAAVEAESDPAWGEVCP